MFNTRTSSPSPKELLGALWALAPVLGFFFGGVFVLAPVLTPLHWVIIKRFGATHGSIGQGVLWAILLGLWSRVPPMPGQMQGAICIVGWFYLICGLLGWLAFTAGIVCGFNGW